MAVMLLRSLLAFFLTTALFYHIQVGYNYHIIQQMCPSSLARNPAQRRQATSSTWWVQAPTKKGLLRPPTPLWSGRFWGRHGCTFDASGRGRCATGDCGGSLFCNGLGGTPPATLAEITLGQRQDFYDVSLVDGYNIAMSITPIKGTGKCYYAGCVSDLNLMCPVGLQVRSNRQVVACKSACFAFNSPRYCCTGRFGNPQSCKPTVYSRIFKAACPKAYSYAYDDPTSIATCTGGNYLVTFCPHHRQF